MDDGRGADWPAEYMQGFVSMAKKKLIEAAHPGFTLPSLAIGEVVEIKGVKFRVQSVAARGRLVLKMLPWAIPPAQGGGGGS